METLARDQIDELLSTATVMHLGCIDTGPYVTALSYVMLDGVIVFRTYGGRRITALRNDSRVAIEVSEVDDETGAWTSVVADGTARIIEDAATAARVESALITKYSDAYENLVSGPSRLPMGEAYIVAIELRNINGRSSGSSWGRRTRPGRL